MSDIDIKVFIKFKIFFFKKNQWKFNFVLVQILLEFRLFQDSYQKILILFSRCFSYKQLPTVYFFTVQLSRWPSQNFWKRKNLHYGENDASWNDSGKLHKNHSSFRLFIQSFFRYIERGKLKILFQKKEKRQRKR